MQKEVVKKPTKTVDNRPPIGGQIVAAHTEHRPGDKNTVVTTVAVSPWKDSMTKVEGMNLTDVMTYISNKCTREHLELIIKLCNNQLEWLDIIDELKDVDNTIVASR